MVRKTRLQLADRDGAPLLITLPDELVQIVRHDPDLLPHVRDDLPVVFDSLLRLQDRALRLVSRHLIVDALILLGCLVRHDLKTLLDH